MSSYKAKPTKFAGVTFRSKSEATFCFALSNYLSMFADEDSWIDYEPSGLKTENGYTPDFLAKTSLFGKEVSLLIEYKPALPNRDYLIEITKRFRELIGDHIYQNAVLAIGTCYDRNVKLFDLSFCSKRKCWTWRDDKWLPYNWNHGGGFSSISEERFDLAQRNVCEQSYGFSKAVRITNNIASDGVCGFSAYREQGRICRLRDAYMEVFAKCKMTSALISKMHDHKGCLSVKWKLAPTGYSKSVVVNAWAKVGEYLVEHHEPNY